MLVPTPFLKPLKRLALAVVVGVVSCGAVAFGFAGAAYALTTPSITTSQQPGSATVGTVVADQATVSAPSSGYACPPEDEAGFALGTGPGDQDLSIDPIFCSYPAVPGENPNDFYCTYSASNGALVSDFDAGLCVLDAVAAGGAVPTGSVTFNLYNNSTGSGTPLFTDTENLVSGVATSAGSTASATGTDYWVATYNGDSNNSSVSSSDSGEPVTITAASPSVSGLASPGSVTVGQSISGQAMVSGGYDPTGSVTFALYSKGSCSGTPLFTDTDEPLSSGAASSQSYMTTGTGTDYWVATYNGDSNNNSVSGSCSGEPVTVNPASPSLSVSAPASGTTGSATAASAIQASLAGAASPSGTITFKVFGPQSSAPSDCSGGITVGTASVSGNGTYSPSAGFTPAAAGNYWWYSSYGGDSNNNSAASTCGAGMTETVVSLPPAPGSTTPPVISGTRKDGQTLTTTHGAWSSPGTLTYAYQWQRCSATGSSCTQTKGATSASYKLTSADVGHKITVLVTATDQWHQTGLATANTVGPVGKPPAPRPTSQPVISGTAKQGHTVKATRGSWSSPDSLSFAYQWQRCSATGAGCAEIRGATRASYELTGADVGHKITVLVTATDREGQAAHATANAVGPVHA